MASDATAAPIIVGVDGSDHSIEALRYGAHLAGALGTPLEAVTTWDFPMTLDSYYPVNWSPEGDAQTVLDQAVDTAFEGNPPAGFTKSVLQCPAARTLIQASKGASMLVLGSRGPTRTAQW